MLIAAGNDPIKIPVRVSYYKDFYQIFQKKIILQCLSPI